MCSHAHKNELKLILFDSVEQCPVRFDMTIPESSIPAAQGVVSVAFGQRIPCAKDLDNRSKLAHILPAFHREQDVLFEPG